MAIFGGDTRACEYPGYRDRPLDKEGPRHSCTRLTGSVLVPALLGLQHAILITFGYSEGTSTRPYILSHFIILRMRPFRILC